MQPTLNRLSKNLRSEFGDGQPYSDRYKRIFHFFGLRENPFNISPDPRYLSFNPRIQAALDAITCGIRTGQGLMLLTGEVGSGKTTLTNYLLNWLRQQHIPTSFIFNSHLNVGDLLDFVLFDFGIACESKDKSVKHSLLIAWLLTRYRAGKTPILIVDEAQGLSSAVLEEIRLLLNLESSRKKLLQIVLVGQPELEEKLDRPELRQLRQRITVHCKIGPLNYAETELYIHRRLRVAGARDVPIFLSDALNAVHFYSCGIPRVINILCEYALINAYTDQIRPVTPKIVNEVAREFQFDKMTSLDARLDFNKTRTTRPISTRSISHDHAGAFSGSGRVARNRASQHHVDQRPGSCCSEKSCGTCRATDKPCGDSERQNGAASCDLASMDDESSFSTVVIPVASVVRQKQSHASFSNFAPSCNVSGLLATATSSSRECTP